jgi:hypothetical protein
MAKASTALTIVTIVGVMTTIYVVDVVRQPADLLIVQATSGSAAPARMVAWWALERVAECPDADFRPTTPVGFVIAAWEKSDDDSSFVKMLELLLARGCDIDRYSDSGLTPLHSAVLFNNVRAVEALLRLGADPNLATEIDGRDARRPINLDARSFAEYLGSASGEGRSSVIAILDKASGWSTSATGD